MLQQLAKITHKLIENDLERFFFNPENDSNWSKEPKLIPNDSTWSVKSKKKRLKIAKGIKKY